MNPYDEAHLYDGDAEELCEWCREPADDHVREGGTFFCFGGTSE